MTRKNLKWILTGATLAAATAFTIFCGSTGYRMTLNAASRKETPVKQTEAAAEEASSDSPEVIFSSDASDETVAAADIIETEGETEETVDIYSAISSAAAESAVEASTSDRSVRMLSDDEIAAISSDYDSTVKNYAPGDTLTDGNVPADAKALQQQFDEKFGSGAVKCICSDSPEVNIAFVCTTADSDGTITRQILDICAEKNIKAEFYITFDFLMLNRSLVERMISEGHDIGTVGATDPSTGLAGFDLYDQMNDIMTIENQMITDYGYTMNKFYPNHNVYSDAQIAMLTQMGFEVCFYTVTYAGDAGTGEIDSEDYLWQLESRVHPGAMYLLHNANTAVSAVLPTFLNYLGNSGYTTIVLE